jgi:hypothetical protein
MYIFENESGGNGDIRNCVRYVYAMVTGLIPEFCIEWETLLKEGAKTKTVDFCL